MKNIYYEMNKGITLIALVITIIILLLLAGITITQLTGSGLFGKAEIANQKTKYVTAKEIIDLKLMEIQTDCTSKGEEYNIVKIAKEMEKAKNIEIEKYYNKETATIKEGIEKNITNLEGIVVSVKEYSEYKFLIGKECQIKGVLEGEVTDTTNEKDFIDIEKFEENTFRDKVATDNIEYSYEKKKIEGIDKYQIIITIKDNENGIDKVEFPDGDILQCNGKNQIAIDYVIDYGVEYVFKITSSNGFVKKATIYEEEKLLPNVLIILDKEYTFTCIDENYQGHKLYLCDEVIPYSICGPIGSTTYAQSKLRNWLNSNAREDAIEVTLEDTGTTDKMFILSKEENEKYKEYTEIPSLLGSKPGGNLFYWLRNYYNSSLGWVWGGYTTNYYNLDILNTSWTGCRPAYVLDH